MMLYYSPFEGKGRSEYVRAVLNRAYLRNFGSPMPEIAKADAGKPYFPARKDIFFSLSHTDNYVMCALGKSDIGVDIQKKRDITPAVIERVCSPDELASLDFFSLWSLKESYIKLCGGLFCPLKDIRFSRADNGIVCLSDSRVFARLYDCAGGCSMAACSFDDVLPRYAVKIDGV